MVEKITSLFINKIYAKILKKTTYATKETDVFYVDDT